MRIQQISPQVLLIRNNDWSRDWISPAFFVFLAGLWHFLFYPLIFENDDPLVYYLTHSLLIGTYPRMFCAVVPHTDSIQARLRAPGFSVDFFPLPVSLFASH